MINTVDPQTKVGFDSIEAQRPVSRRKETVMFVSKRVGIAVGIAVFFLLAIPLFYFTQTKSTLKPIKIYKAVYPENPSTTAKADRSSAGAFQADTPSTETPSHVPETQNFRSDATDNDDPILDDEILYLFEAFIGEDAITSEVAEESVDAPHGFSPYGFGPFPEVPTDYPRSAEAVWGEARLLTMLPEHELLSRVQIELWNQGVRTVGSVYNTDYDLIFSVLDNVVYIQREFSAEDGEPYISSMLGSPATINRYEDDLFEGNFPPHLTIYEYPDGGINPYEFLDVSR